MSEEKFVSHSAEVEFCSNTGRKIGDRGGKFCPCCGQPWKAAATEAPAPVGTTTTQKPVASGVVEKEAPKKEAPKGASEEHRDDEGLLPVTYISGPGSKSPTLNYIWRGVLPSGIKNPFGRVVFKDGAEAGKVCSIFAWFADNGPRWPQNIVAYPDGRALQGQAPRNREPLVLKELTREKMTLVPVSEEAQKPALFQPEGAGVTIEKAPDQPLKCATCGVVLQGQDACPSCGKPTGIVRKPAPAAPAAPPKLAPTSAPQETPAPAVVQAVAAHLKGKSPEELAKELEKLKPAMRAAVEAELRPTPAKTTGEAVSATPTLKISEIKVEDLEIAVIPATPLPDGVKVDIWRAVRAAGEDIVEQAKLAVALMADLKIQDTKAAMELVGQIAAIEETEGEVLPVRIVPSTPLPDGFTPQDWLEASAVSSDFVRMAVVAKEWVKGGKFSDSKIALAVVQQLAGIGAIKEAWRPTLEEVKAAKGPLPEATPTPKGVDVAEQPTPKNNGWTCRDLAEFFGNDCVAAAAGSAVIKDSAKQWKDQKLETAAGWLLWYCQKGLNELVAAVPMLQEYYASKKAEKKESGKRVVALIVQCANEKGIRAMIPPVEKAKTVQARTVEHLKSRVEDLCTLAHQLGISGFSKMTKDSLARAIAEAQIDAAG